MKKINFIIGSLLLGFFIFSKPIIAQENSISGAHQLMLNKEFQEARTIYMDLLEEGFGAKALYYNLGIANYELGDFPEAILYFEKALKSDPRDQDIQHNLNLANKKIEQDFIKVKDFFLKEWWNSFIHFFSVSIWTGLIFVLLLFCLLCFYLFYFRQNFVYSKWAKRFFVPGLLVLIVVFLAAWGKGQSLQSESGGIIMTNIGLYTGPDERSELLYELKPGTKVLILDELGPWFKVELINHERGWLEDSGLKRI